MSLDWNVSKVKDFKTVCFENWTDEEGGRLKPRTNGLIWLCLCIDMPGITEKNRDEFWDRVQTWETVEGAMLQNDKGPMPMSKEDVYAHVGLSTNVSYKSKRAFQSKMEKIALEKATKKK